MPNPPVLCECGHRRATHWNREGRCMSPGHLNHGCPCLEFTHGTINTRSMKEAGQ